jgi:hypothetical protein
MSPDTPVIGRRRVAAQLGISASTLKRWMNDCDVEERFRLRDFVFRVRSRVATTPRLAGQFVDHVRSIDPREVVRREVAEVAKEIRK